MMIVGTVQYRSWRKVCFCAVKIVMQVLQKNMYTTWKDIQDSEYYNYAIHIISHVSQTIKLKGITGQKSL